jgi:hypothetical protein
MAIKLPRITTARILHLGSAFLGRELFMVIIKPSEENGLPVQSLENSYDGCPEI